MALLRKNNPLENKNNSTAESELISQIKHKLRTPLTSITLALELLERELTSIMNEKAKEYLTAISDGIKDMTELIESLSKLKKK